MNSNRKTAIIVGALILVAYGVLASSITDSKITVLFFEVISGIAVIGIAVLMFPLFKLYNEKLSIWYIVFRSIEGGLMIIAGILFLSNSTSLLGIRDGIYMGHGFIFAVAALMFYHLLYITKLIPRFIPVWGVIAAILLILGNLLEITGFIHPLLIYFYLPIVLNEVFLAFWLIIKGFNPSAIGSESAKGVKT
jgi:hypothetical protein